MGETELERLVVRLVGDGSSYQRMIAEAEKASSHLTEQINFHSRRIAGLGLTVRGWGSSVIGMVSAVASVAGIGAGIGAAFKGVSLAGQMEENQVSFGVMLGDMEKGKKIVEDMRQFAAATPLNQPDIQQAAKVLLQYAAVNENDLIPTLRMLGDVTGGNAERFRQMSYAFGQVSATGHLMGQDLLQMINAGFNPLKEISRTSGRSVDDLRAAMEKGQVTVGMVKEAFRTATSAGGQFFGLMEKQSQTLKGLFSTMQDDVSMALEAVGEEIVKTFGLKEAMKNVSNFAQEVGRWVPFLGDLFRSTAEDVKAFTKQLASDAWAYLLREVPKFVEENRRLVYGLTAAAFAAGALYAAFYVLRLAFVTTLAVAHLLHLDLVVGAALWLAYKALVLGTSVVLGVYQFAVWGINAASLVTTATTTALSAALAALNAVSVVPLLASLATGILLFGAFNVAVANVGGAAAGAGAAAAGVVDFFKALPSDSGPVKAVVDVTSEWYDKLKDVAGIAAYDLPGAFKLLRSGLDLAASQVTDLWPPLWAFVDKGFGILWDKVRADFVKAFREARTEILIANDEFQRELGRKLAQLPSRLWDALTGGEAEDAAKKLGDTIEAGGGDFGDWTDRLRDAVEEMDAAVEESDATEVLRKRFEDLREEIEQVNAEKAMTDIWDPLAKGAGVADAAAKQLLATVHKFDAAEAGGAEALSRLLEYRDAAGLSPNVHDRAGTATPATGAGDDVGGGGWAQPADVFYQIRDYLKDMAESRAVAVPAGLDDVGGGDF